MYLNVRMLETKFTMVFKYWHDGDVNVYMSTVHKLPDSKKCDVKYKNTPKIVLQAQGEKSEVLELYITLLSNANMTIDTAVIFGEKVKSSVIDITSSSEEEDKEKIQNWKELPEALPTKEEEEFKEKGRLQELRNIECV
jgi:hypothetical protein